MLGQTTARSVDVPRNKRSGAKWDGSSFFAGEEHRLPPQDATMLVRREEFCSLLALLNAGAIRERVVIAEDQQHSEKDDGRKTSA